VKRRANLFLKVEAALIFALTLISLASGVAGLAGSWFAVR